MLKSFSAAALLTLAVTLPVWAAPDQVWQDIPAQAPIAMGLDWAPGQWDLLTRQPAVHQALHEVGKQLDAEFLTDMGLEGRAFVPHLGSQMALAANLDFDKQPWFIASFALKNEAAVRALLEGYVAEKRMQRRVLASGSTVFVLERERQEDKIERIVLQVAHGRLRGVIAAEMGLIEQLLQSPSLWPQVQAQITAHPQKGLWFVGEPQHFGRMTTMLLMGVGAKPPQQPGSDPLIMGMGLDAQGLYGQAWQREQPLAGAPLDLVALAPLIPADSFFFHAFALKTPLLDSLVTLGEQWGPLFGGPDLKKWRQLLEPHTGIDWPQLVTGLNGQMAWSAALSTNAQDPTPTLQAYLGTTQPQQSYQALKAMQLNPRPFTEPMTGRRLHGVQSGLVRSNAHTLQAMVETFGEEHGGLYPEDISSLMRAAQANDPYWKELTNPVTKQSGIGKALDSFQNFKRQGFPASAAGQVFYEPLGKRQPLVPGKPKQGGYPGYRIYAYVFNGNMDVLTNDERLKLKQPLMLKPWAQGNDQGGRMFWKQSPQEPSLLQLHDSFAASLPLWMGEHAGFLRLGNRPQPLTQKPSQSLFQGPEFRAARAHVAPRQMVYIQIPKLLKVSAPVDRELSVAVGDCIRGVEHFFLEEMATPAGSDLRFRLKVDMSQFDVGAIETCIKQATRVESE